MASLAGLNGKQAISSADVLLERATGREFIIDMQKKFSIDRDLYFNTYDPLLLELLEAAVVDVVRQVFSEVVIEPCRPKVFPITIYPHVYVLAGGLLALEASRVTELDPARSTV